METTRQNKISRLLQKELSEIFLLQTKAMQGTLVSVSVVRISPDMSIARVYLSIFPSEKGVITSYSIHYTKLYEVQSQTWTSQLRKDIVSQVLVNWRDVFDFSFSLFRILVHRKYAKNQFFVLDVWFRNQFLETFPVFSSVFCINNSINFSFLQLFAKVS